MKSQSTVYLVGAGPGDTGLITVRGARLLELADVVVYDNLANPALLENCRLDAERIFAGKTAERHSMSQEQINALLIEKARENEGRTIVRLKGGDPFVFGRGGEEAEALRSAHIPFEIVPGITAGIAASAYAGIPVTHRDFNSSFTIVTGHEREDDDDSSAAIDWATLAKLPCIAFYMGVKSLPNICQKLIDNGMPSNTPAATIRWGTTPKQITIVGTIADLPAKVAAANLGPPAITIVGKVVELRESINWFEKRPLFGQTIVVTRTRQQASELSAKLIELGANVIEAPTIEIVPIADPSKAIDALHEMEMGGYDWVIFTSTNAVRAVKTLLFDERLDARAFSGADIAAIGESTARELEQQLGFIPQLVPPKAVADVLADVLEDRKEVAGKRFLILRADIGRPLLNERLKKGGAGIVSDIAIYETRIADSLPAGLLDVIDGKQVNWITFTSSSTAENLAKLLGPDYRQKLSGIRLASIGPITSQTLRELELEPTVQAESFEIDGLVRAICQSAGTS